MRTSKWRKHQIKLQKQRKRAALWTRLRSRLFILMLVVLAVYFGWRHVPAAYDGLARHIDSAKAAPASNDEVEAPVVESSPPSITADGGPTPQVVVLSPRKPGEDQGAALPKDRLAEMIGPRDLLPEEIRSFTINDKNGHKLIVSTTLDPALQGWAMDFLPKVKAQAVALVALDPATGNVLCMAGNRDDGAEANPALESSFPAASIFKIITAAAAVEEKQMTSQTTLAFSGRKTTLYKKQINADIKKGDHEVTLRESFADSINSVFGKLGAFSLGPMELETFAQKFGFNAPIRFEMPVQASRFEMSEEDDPFSLAELASGYNRTTKVSPLHGAMLASAIINDGKLMEPTIVREVFDQNNKIFYTHEPVFLGRVVSERTVQELRKLMRATIIEGTGRRRFGDISRHKILSQLEIGGKSGTINNDQGHLVDWFVCYAKEKTGKEAIAMAAVVVHNAKLGTRSQELIREAIIHHFSSKLK